MKTKILFATLLMSFFLVLDGFAQGVLTPPPGPPAPMMKSLDQIEARTPISAAGYVITQPGCYYLTTNLFGTNNQSGVTIATNNVTLDLNGFALVGLTNSADGVLVSGNLTNITVRNGSVEGWALGSPGTGGITGYTAYNFLCERLTVSHCYDGILSGTGTVSDCVVQSSTTYGILAIRPCTVRNCVVEGNGSSGIYVESSGSYLIGNTCAGNNTSDSSSDAGITVINWSNNRIENNHISASGYAGILLIGSAANNIIIKNSVSGNGANNYVTPGNQVVGPLITAYGTITNSNPWANFSL